MENLGFVKTRKLLTEYRIPFGKSKLADSKKEAAAFAGKIGYPVVLKVSSKKPLHKTDLGLVKLDIKDAKELEKAWSEIIETAEKKIRQPAEKIEGILVQKELKGEEIMIGMKRDAQFGPVIMFGLGGIFVEALKDVSFRIAPVKKENAYRMMGEIKGHKVLQGLRGQKPVNLDKLAEIIVALSKLSLAEKKIKEIDLNPVIANERGAQVADARFLIL